MNALLGEACSHLATALYDASERLVAVAGALPGDSAAESSRAERDAAEAAAADASTDYTDPASMPRAAARRMVRAERLEGLTRRGGSGAALSTAAPSRGDRSSASGAAAALPSRGGGDRAKLQFMAALHRECEGALSWPVEVHARLLASLRASTAAGAGGPAAPQGGDGTRAVMGQCAVVWASRREGEVAAARAAKAEQEAHAAYEDAAVRKVRSGRDLDTLPFYLTPAPPPPELATAGRSTSGAAAAGGGRSGLRSDAATEKFWTLLTQPAHKLSEEEAEHQVMELAMLTRRPGSVRLPALPSLHPRMQGRGRGWYLAL